MKVNLNSQSARSFRTNAGADQGSDLVPTVFIFFINDVLDDMSSQLVIYADDPNFYSCHDCKADQSDKFILSADV